MHTGLRVLHGKEEGRQINCLTASLCQAFWPMPGPMPGPGPDPGPVSSGMNDDSFSVGDDQRFRVSCH